jgi:hypothetical protein
MIVNQASPLRKSATESTTIAMKLSITEETPCAMTIILARMIFATATRDAVIRKMHPVNPRPALIETKTASATTSTIARTTSTRISSMKTATASERLATETTQVKKAQAPADSSFGARAAEAATRVSRSRSLRQWPDQPSSPLES